LSTKGFLDPYISPHTSDFSLLSRLPYQSTCPPGILTGEWPTTITLNAQAGDRTVIIIVTENGTQTTINADGTVTTGHTDNTDNSGTGGGSETGSGGSENQNQSGGGTQTGGDDGGGDDFDSGD